MGVHVVGKNEYGETEIRQVPDDFRPDPEAGGVPRPVSRRTLASSEAPAPALLELVEDMHNKPVGWAVDRIARLDTVQDLDRVMALEKSHPLHPGGRIGILNAVRRRLGDPSVSTA